MDGLKESGTPAIEGRGAGDAAACPRSPPGILRRDLAASPLYRQVAQFYSDLHVPGQGRVTDAMDIALAPDGTSAAFTGMVHDDLARPPGTRICTLDLRTGVTGTRDAQGGNDKHARWSRDGRLAFLSDRGASGTWRLYIAERPLGPASAAPALPGVCEFIEWAPNGRAILLGVAGFGADLPGAQGGATTAQGADASAPWVPVIETADAENRWRRLHVHDLATGLTRTVSPPGLNVWEAAWLGNDRIAAIVSDSHSEDSWYGARLATIDLVSGAVRVVHAPRDQIGYPAATPSGRHLAFIEAPCSDRLLVAGVLKVVQPSHGPPREVDTLGADVTHALWRDERYLVYAGQRRLETVVGEYDAESGRSEELWSSEQRTFAGWQPTMWPLRERGCVAIGEAWGVAPEVAVIRDGTYTSLHSFGASPAMADEPATERIEAVAWTARDGLDMDGWLVRPALAGPVPVVMDIHGGPVWSHRNRWSGRLRGAKLLADRGIATFYPNPRGSSGRGIEFARRVKGDLGGEDAQDCLAGLDSLVARGIADPARLGVTGVSYGGFLSAWLVTQDTRFAAAVPISPICNWYSQHRTSQIGFFDASFLQGRADEPGGHYFERSPVMFAHRARTPTLLMAGATDQNTPAGQALEFHRSLVEHGGHSVLVNYPNAGHGIRSFPELVDAITRYVGWMLHFLGTGAA